MHVDEFAEGAVIGRFGIFWETTRGQLLHAEVIMKTFTT